MSEISPKISKHRRLNRVMDILKRWAPLETAEVASLVAKSFEVSVNDIKRNVLNDLKFLRDEGEVVSQNIDKFGNVTMTEDGYYSIQWNTTENEKNQISGCGELRSFGGDILCSPVFEKKISLRSGKTQKAPGIYILYFELNYELFHLKIDFNTSLTPIENQSFRLGISANRGRLPKHYSSELPFDIMLSLNDPFISSYRNENPTPLLITQSPNNCSFICGNNKNPVTSLEAEQAKVDETLKQLSFYREQTKTQHWHDLMKPVGDDFQTGDQNFISPPFLFKVNDQSAFLFL